jgi:hypothetical protein
MNWSGVFKFALVAAIIYFKMAIAMIVCLYPTLANAQWWNPLAPKDYNDCIIKNLKDGMGEDAVRALKFACYEKYPPRTTAAEKKEETTKKMRMSKCGLDDDHYKFHWFFNLNEKRIINFKKHLESIIIEEYSSHNNHASIQNKNAFAISGVMIGLTGAKSCSLNSDSYEAVAYCHSTSTDSGIISSMSYGRFRCSEVPKKAKSMGYCVIGYSPRYYKFDDSLLKFKEDNGLCAQ